MVGAVIRSESMDSEPKTADTSPAQPDRNALARSRAAACHAALSKVLAEYDCRIVPMLAAPEAVGAEGAAMLVRATYAIIPNL